MEEPSDLDLKISKSIGDGPIDLNKWRLWIKVFGVPCAAWLVRSQTRSVRERGLVDLAGRGHFKLHLPRGERLDLSNRRFMWFKLALACLRSRKDRWRVWERTRADRVEYEFRFIPARPR